MCVYRRQTEILVQFLPAVEKTAPPHDLSPGLNAALPQVAR
jgi:hypothetical protein